MGTKSGSMWEHVCVTIVFLFQLTSTSAVTTHAECVSAGEIDSNQLQTTVLYCRLVVVVLLVSLRRRWSLAGERTGEKLTEESRREMSHIGYVVISVPSGK